MDSRLILVSLLLAFVQFDSATRAWTNSNDESALNALRRSWDVYPPNWGDNDPCGNSWVGIQCFKGRVISIQLTSMGLKGELSGDILGLSELRALDLSYNQNLTGGIPASIGSLKKLVNLTLIGCGFSGPIPDTIGYLSKLTFLSLTSNRFNGSIPPSIGSLSSLTWLDLTNNQLSGTIPISDGTTPGLDMLVHTQHFHLGNNWLSGSIPPRLFSPNMALIHLLLNNNNLAGSIPSTLGLVKALQVIRLDGNSLSGPIPSNINNLTEVSTMILSNNKLTGDVPDLTGMYSLSYLDMSNNSFTGSGKIPSWFSVLTNLTILIMEGTRLGGPLPVSLFSLGKLQTVMLRINEIDGTLDFGPHPSTQLQLVDLQQNRIDDTGLLKSSSQEVNIILVGNPICQEGANTKYCTISSASSPSLTPPLQDSCRSHSHVYASDCILSPNCQCVYPYTGTLVYRLPTFQDIENIDHYKSTEDELMNLFQRQGLPVESVLLTNPRTDQNDCLKVSLQVFPRGKERFNRTEMNMVGSALSSYLQAFYFIADQNQHFEELPSLPGQKTKSDRGIIIGAAAGGFSLVLLLLIAGIYAFCQKRRAEKATEQSNPFAKWKQIKSTGSFPHLKGARRFTFVEIKKCTQNFSEANEVGTGGYGKVYKGILLTGQMIAIKRNKQGSLQGRLEFKTEIELLSRVHHKNVVNLVGFCFERGEQMLVYEFVPKGSLNESLSGKSGIRLDWRKRLNAALGAARGLAYLHELAEPPIIHRDINSNNILLDERLNAKVADFGLCKLLSDSEKGHVTTQVKGTMGYLDPEYCMSQQLTEKSDVYSFGVLMLELISARKPIQRGKHIVKEVKIAMDKTKDLYNLEELIDPTLGTALGGFDKYVDLALRCVQESGADRPTMGEVVKEIENIMQGTGLNTVAESSSASASYEELSTEISSHPYGDSLVYSPSTVQPK